MSVLSAGLACLDAVARCSDLEGHLWTFSILGVSATVMSRHLRVLRDAQLVDEEHPPFDARVRIYSLQAAPMDALKSWLADAETGWSEELAAFKSHVERE